MITTDIFQWKDVLNRTGIKYTEEISSGYGCDVLTFALRYFMSESTKLINAEIIVAFSNDSSHIFKSISYRNIGGKVEPAPTTDVSLAVWTNLLKNSEVYYALKEFKTRRWSSRWLEFPCNDVTGKQPIAIELPYSSRFNNPPAIFDMHVSEIF